MNEPRIIVPGQAPRNFAYCESAAAKMMRVSRLHRELADRYNSLLDKAQCIQAMNTRLMAERAEMLAILVEHGLAQPETPAA